MVVFNSTLNVKHKNVVVFFFNSVFILKQKKITTERQCCDLEARVSVGTSWNSLFKIKIKNLHLQMRRRRAERLPAGETHGAITWAAIALRRVWRRPSRSPRGSAGSPWCSCSPQTWAGWRRCIRRWKAAGGRKTNALRTLTAGFSSLNYHHRMTHTFATSTIRTKLWNLKWITSWTLDSSK